LTTDECTAINNEQVYTSQIENGIGLTFNSNNKCLEDPTKFYSLQVNYICDSSKTIPFLTTDVNHPQTCNFQLNYQSDRGCVVFSYGLLQQLLMKYNQYWGAGLIVIGLALAFAGNKFINATIFLVASVAVASVGLFFTFSIM
jgi:hypothetical protein